MGPYNSPLFQSVPVLDYIAPASQAAGTYNSSGFSTTGINQFEALVLGGTLSTGTLDFKFQYSLDGGTTWTDVDSTKCKITQITASGKIARLAMRTESLASLAINAAKGASMVRGVLTVGTASSPVAVVILGADSRFEPGSNIAAVAQTYLYTKSAGQP